MICEISYVTEENPASIYIGAGFCYDSTGFDRRVGVVLWKKK